MTIQQALDIQQNFWKFNGNYTDDDFFMFTEASHFLIEETGEAKYMFDLVAEYYERREFDLALKYYELAAKTDMLPQTLVLAISGITGAPEKSIIKRRSSIFPKIAAVTEETSTQGISRLICIRTATM